MALTPKQWAGWARERAKAEGVRPADRPAVVDAITQRIVLGGETPDRVLVDELRKYKTRRDASVAGA
jgi:hypothetical protein